MRTSYSTRLRTHTKRIALRAPLSSNVLLLLLLPLLMLLLLLLLLLALLSESEISQLPRTCCASPRNYARPQIAVSRAKRGEKCIARALHGTIDTRSLARRASRIPTSSEKISLLGYVSPGLASPARPAAPQS